MPANMSAKVPFCEVSQWSELEAIPMDLYTASSVGCEDRVREIISASAEEINTKNKDGWTALMYAAYSGDHNVLKYLLEKGANPNTRNNKGVTPLMLAANCGNTNSAVFLIEEGSDVNAKDDQNWTALFYASSTGHRSVIQVLVEHGARINIMEDKNGMTPLMLASAAGHEMIVKDLLQYGASISISSKNGETARTLAVRYGHLKVKNAIDAYLVLQRNYSPAAADRSKDGLGKFSDVKGVLESLGLAKYYPVFQSHGIDLSVFWTLTDPELKEIGIEMLGPRKKISSAISKYKASKTSVLPITDAQLLIDKLIEERKSLQQRISELSQRLTNEESMRISSELRLAESLQVLKNFNEKVNTMCTQLVHSQDGLKTLLQNLKQVLNLSTSVVSLNSMSGSEMKAAKVTSLISVIENIIDDMKQQISPLLS